MHSITLTFFSLASFASLAAAHTWGEQLQVIGADGTYKGNPGYIRSYTPRSDPAFSDSKNVFLQPPNGEGRTRINARDLACAPQQQSAQYTNGYPMLQASPGDYYAIKYLENAHVTQPELLPGKPQGGGTVVVFMMSNMQPGATLEDILKLSADGSLGTGKLIASGNFDDDRCYQINTESSISSAKSSFPTPFRIPTDAPSSGTLSGIWVWAWPTEGEGAKDEYYTSCFDVALGGSGGKYTNGTATPLAVQDPNTKAVDGWQSRKADVADPMVYLSMAEDA